LLNVGTPLLSSFFELCLTNELADAKPSKSDVYEAENEESPPAFKRKNVSITPPPPPVSPQTYIDSSIAAEHIPGASVAS
ncbi:MAG: hypothetical protein M1835_004264, partial [Candelina submexicana]